LNLPFQTQEIFEGKARLLVPRLTLYSRGENEYIPSLSPVFYNPRMELCRSIAVMAIQAYQRGLSRPLKVADPFTGCGVRGIRIALEVEGTEAVFLNDLNHLAYRLTELNITMNGLTDILRVTNLDANLFLCTYSAPRKRFDVVDLDPYGSPAPFIESAIRALRDGGLIAMTATDMAPLCGVNSNACIRRYAGRPLRSEYCKEVAVRLLASALTMAAARHDIGVKVKLSHSTDHYIRIYAQLEHGAKLADHTVSMLGYISHCFTCLNRRWQIGLLQDINKTCNVCGGVMEIAGPLWLGPLVDEDFCKAILAEAEAISGAKRLVRLLRLLAGEAKAPPTYFVIDAVCDRLNLPVPPKRTVMDSLRDLGYKVVETHFEPTAIKTDAPVMAVREVLKHHRA
jgi:tRNA (guanine26-N2/guanine27-N2)-dimethyltransferase